MRNLELLDPLHNTTVGIRQKVLLFGASTTQLSYFRLISSKLNQTKRYAEW